ncbi:hypothetical protein [Mycolicibacterium sp. YH-1]|uniref:hypothetical protein n=1 Tax=Mycolicibacterium sp. YH-1 TaxID=2908837 RepID=UPI001F4BD143|nr:hypothetical protein [Mycolicibacterium sp. YH-1]UNB50133.1 hypothetical protein L0M16_19285 [Mycolicibacterium sp. YH-1]
MPAHHPADVERRALELLVAVQEAVVKADALTRPMLQDVAGLLQLEEVFGGLAWPDAQRAAILVLLSVVNHVDPAAAMRERAHLVLTEGGEDVWQDRTAVVRSISAAASVLDCERAKCHPSRSATDPPRRVATLGDA